LTTQYEPEKSPNRASTKANRALFKKSDASPPSEVLVIKNQKSKIENSMAAPSQPSRLDSRSDGPPPAERQLVRVLLVDDHPIVRLGLRACLSGYRQLDVVGEADNGWDALDLAKKFVPDVVLMDLEMPRMDGLAATRMLRQQLPTVKVLMLSMHRRTEQILSTIDAGASGYLLKDAPILQLVKAIEAVCAGGTCFHPEIAGLALNRVVRDSGQGRPPIPLSPREREVLVALAEGLQASETAERLAVSTRTVQTHRERLRAKLNIHSIAGLTRFAIEHGLIANPKM
jgi:DNA-binding NarL/FixJ family response regulator